jgi:transaldolase
MTPKRLAGSLAVASERRSAEPATKNAFGLRVGVYADGAVLSEMLAEYERGRVQGFTTNPTLMAKAGVRDYEGFAREVLGAIRDLPISFEVFADDFPTMAAQARRLASWGDNVYVKIPVMNTRRMSSLPLIRGLAREGVKLNVTAIMTLEQVCAVVDALEPGVPAIASIFAGRIADTGRDPVPIVREAAAIAQHRADLQILWASPREVLNVYQAEACGCHVITMTPDLLAKLALRGKNLDEFSRETVQMFYDDATRAGFTL